MKKVLAGLTSRWQGNMSVKTVCWDVNSPEVVLDRIQQCTSLNKETNMWVVKVEETSWLVIWLSTGQQRCCKIKSFCNIWSYHNESVSWNTFAPQDLIWRQAFRRCNLFPSSGSTLKIEAKQVSNANLRIWSRGKIYVHQAFRHSGNFHSFPAEGTHDAMRPRV
jgi:hypothetical protein